MALKEINDQAFFNKYMVLVLKKHKLQCTLAQLTGKDAYILAYYSFLEEPQSRQSFCCIHQLHRHELHRTLLAFRFDLYEAFVQNTQHYMVQDFSFFQYHSFEYCGMPV